MDVNQPYDVTFSMKDSLQSSCVRNFIEDVSNLHVESFASRIMSNLLRIILGVKDQQ